MKLFNFGQKGEDVLFGPVYDPDKPKPSPVQVTTKKKAWKNPGGPAPARSRDFRQNDRRRLNFIDGSLGSFNIFS